MGTLFHCRMPNVIAILYIKMKERSAEQVMGKLFNDKPEELLDRLLGATFIHPSVKEHGKSGARLLAAN